jgi:protoporphyrinogen/coproporphyrinogen III oxidase
MTDESAAAPTVAVVGAGISGLAAAKTLTEHRSPPRVVLLEADDRPGGKILTDHIEGVPVEAGPDWFVTRQPWATELCRSLGLGQALVPPARSGAYLWLGGRLLRLPDNFVRGIPVNPWAAVTGGLLSVAGALRASADLGLPGPLRGPDVSIGHLIRRRLGSEVLERLVDPVLAGSRAGRADEMSLAAAAPELDVVARSRSSLILGLRQSMRNSGSGAVPPFLGIEGGMTRLVDALVSSLARRAEMLLGERLERLLRDGRRFRLETAGGRKIAADGVVLAIPAFAAADALHKVSEGAARQLRAIPYASAAVVTLVYPPGAGSPPRDVAGLLVPSIEGRALTAASWYSQKWPQAKLPGEAIVMRCFVGRATDDPAPDLDDERMARRVIAEIGAAASLSGEPRLVRVVRWDRALPEYAVGHNERLDRIYAALEDVPGVALAGAGYRGSGLPDCIRQGVEAADKVIAASSATGWG